MVESVGGSQGGVFLWMVERSDELLEGLLALVKQTERLGGRGAHGD